MEQAYSLRLLCSGGMRGARVSGRWSLLEFQTITIAVGSDAE